MSNVMSLGLFKMLLCDHSRSYVPVTLRFSTSCTLNNIVLTVTNEAMEYFLVCALCLSESTVETW